MEVEAKFRIPDRKTYRMLLQLQELAGYSLAPLGRVQVTDRYYDTPDGHFLAASFSCRLRSQDGQILVTLKGLGGAEGGMHRRAEHEVALPSEMLNPADWPLGEARDLALELVGEASLQPLVDLKQIRAKRDLMDGERRVAEVSLDAVRATVGKRPTCYYEMEVELSSEGTEDDLYRVAAALQGEHGLTPEPRSKFERALSARGRGSRRRQAAVTPAEGGVTPVGAAALTIGGAPQLEEAPALPEPPSVHPDDPMSEAGRKVIFTHFMRMLANEAGTREGVDIEFLHDMRVSTRRMRAAFRIFEPFYSAKAVKRFNKGLRRTGGALGVVRDLDVLIEKAEAYEAGLSPTDGLTIQPLLESWRAVRDRSRLELTEYLDSSAYRRFVEEFRAFLETPGAHARPIPVGEPVAYQVRHIVPRLVMERYEQVRAYEPILDGAPVTTYHRLRIDCKRLRYALEFFAPLLGAGAPALIKQVTGMQDLLGAMQDAHVAEGLIAEFLAGQGKRKKKAPPPQPMPGVEAYHLAQRQLQAELLAAFPAPWKSLTGLAFRRSLGLALATP